MGAGFVGSYAMKPHIKKGKYGLWLCSAKYGHALSIGYGITPLDAYHNWILEESKRALMYAYS